VSNPWADDENKSHAITALPRAVRQQDARRGLQRTGSANQLLDPVINFELTRSDLARIRSVCWQSVTTLHNTDGCTCLIRWDTRDALPDDERVNVMRALVCLHGF
jgi:hypothetical protein